MLLPAINLRSLILLYTSNVLMLGSIIVYKIYQYIFILMVEAKQQALINQ
jgi:hypothetical protein